MCGDFFSEYVDTLPYSCLFSFVQEFGLLLDFKYPIIPLDLEYFFPPHCQKLLESVVMPYKFLE